jgi:hypothetical protein
VSEDPSAITGATMATAVQTAAARSSASHRREEKIQAISKLLRDWRWTFGDLCLTWLQKGSGKRHGLKKKSRDLTVALLKDEIFYKMFEEVEELHGTLIELVIRLFRTELDDLQKMTVISTRRWNLAILMSTRARTWSSNMRPCRSS